MSVPGIVEDHLEGESVTARVSLGGDDELFVTPSRTLIYRGEGLLRDESIDEYDHDVERLSVSEGRRKTTITLEYPIDGTREFTLPSDGADEALTPLLEGVLTAWGVLEDGESVVAAYRFSELSLIVAERRLVKHVGEALLDEDYEEFRYEDVTDLGFEEGSVATQVVLTVGGRQERIKTPSDAAAEVRTRLETALQEFYGVDTNEALHAALGEDDTAEDGEAAVDDGAADFGGGVDPLGANPPGGGEEADDAPAGETAAAAAGTVDDGAASEREASTERDAGTRDRGSTTRDRDAAGRDAGSADRDRADHDRGAADRNGEPDEGARNGADRSAGSAGGGATASDDDLASAGFEPAETGEASYEELRAEVEELREAVERQNQLLTKQQRTIEQLIEELSRGR